VRFFCEWCHRRVDIRRIEFPAPEIREHFFGCDHRPPFASNKHIDGLALHIAGLVGQHMEFVLKVRQSLAG
jgi:hypothetical protein